MTQPNKTEFVLIVGIAAVVSIVAIGGLVYLGAVHPLYVPVKASSEAVALQTTQVSIETLLDAIEQIESGGDSEAIGDSGRAIGAYQIWEIYVDDANRILGWDKYTYEDRWDKSKSREMTAIVIQHYGKGDIETMARAHKCPPERYSESTKPYWEKVKARLEL